MKLIDLQGQRLYLTSKERADFLEAAKKAPREICTFCIALHYTGCRISEALALTPRLIDFSDKALVFKTLKKRDKTIYRAVPIPEETLDTLEMVHGLTEALNSKKSTILNKPLWPWARMTGYRYVKAVMDEAGIPDGPHKCPKGLRHGFGVHAISKGVPLNMLSKWLGHSTLEMTSIYTDALGEEQRSIASRMWE